MTVGREPAGYRLARLARERGWRIQWKARPFDYGHAYGVAARVFRGDEVLASHAVMRRSPRRLNPTLTLTIELRAHVAAALLRRLPC